MGVADLVPGVSGGTVALLLGIYDRFIATIRGIAAIPGNLLRGDTKGAIGKFKQADWHFALPLVVGVLVAVFSLASLMENLLHDYPEEMAGVFSGLVLASLVTAYLSIERRDNSALALKSRLTILELFITVAVAVGVFFLLGLSATPQTSPSLLVYFGAGALAICAMVLPGISGSFLLLTVGMYAALLAAVDDLALTELLVFCLGAAVGLALFSTFLHRLLTQFRHTTTAVLLGLLLGSMRVLWPWPNGVGIVSDTDAIDGTLLEWPTLSQAWLPTLLALAAFTIILTLSALPRILKGTHKARSNKS